jgi:hypothetical protein
MSPPEENTVSWLTMERYVLGELGENERREVERCLAESEAARARLKSILDEASVLPELPNVVPIGISRSTSARAWVRWGSALAAAALVGLAFVSLREVERVGEPGFTRGHVKGGEFTFQLVSESGAHEPDTFEQGERFKVLVTSPPGADEQLRLLVFQAGVRFEPLAPARMLGGNLVPWPGAFELDGDAPVEVCVTSEARAARAKHRTDLGEHALCKFLSPR